MFSDFRRHRAATAKTLVSRNGQNNVAIEALEARQLMALLGVSLTDLPIEFYNSTGQMQYDTATGAFDVSATPTAVFLPTGPRAITATHGDFQIHARISNTGALVSGVNFGDLANLGNVNAAGDDFVMRGAVDLDGNGSIDPITETGDLLRGEIFAFGFQDSGGPTDQYDYKFVLTGGLLASQFANRDIGVTMTSENSGFEGSFGVSYTGQAKGSVGPIASPLVSSIGGFVYYDQNNDGIFQGTESPIPGTLVTLTGINDAGIAVLQTMNTLGDGSYLFTGLRPGTYRLTETQPATYLDGKDTIGTPGGATTNDQFSNIVLPANYNGVNNNFGEIRASSIGGYVYYDQNNDGVFQRTESPIPGTRITLTGTDDLGNAINMSMNTLADGSYLFSGLRPGTYQIDETQPATYIDGKDTIGTPGGTTTNDRFSNISLPVGYDGVNNNFGEIRVSSIGGYVYYDRNNDGIFQGTESPIPGTRVTLTGTDDLGNAVNMSMNTLANGSYLFTNLRPGTYQLDETQPATYLDGKDTVGTPGGTTTNDRFSNINLPVGFDGVNNNFGEILASSIGGYVYYDLNNDGIFQGTESPIPGTRITLTGTDDLGNAVNMSMNTLANGSYLFSNLRPGIYQIDETQPATYLDGIDTIGTPGGTTTNDRFSNINLPAGFNGVNNNFGEIRVGSINGKKWLDITGNGLTSDDTGFGGVTIYIDANNNGTRDSGERSTVTATDGTYSFSGLNAGSYIIREVVPANYVRTAPTLTDRYVVTLGTGQTVTNIDFANTRACDCYSLSSFNFLINGTTVVSDLRGNTNQGDEVTVIFTVPAGQSPYTFSLVSYTAPENYFDANTASQQRIYDLATGVYGPGTYTMTVILPDSNYQVDFVCGSAIDRLGPAGSNIFYSAQRRLLSADNDGNCDPLPNAAEIRGQVYVDRDNDGVIDSNETGIANVTLRLTGTDNLGQSVSLYTKSYSDGTYVFGNLRPGTYKVTETQPANFTDGKETVGTLGGNKTTNDQLAAITIGSNQLGTNYNFGEQAIVGSNLDGGTTATLGFWIAEGRKLLTSLNGSANDTDLGNWMASNFPRMFGSSAGSAFNLAGKTNTQVADAFLKRLDQYSERLDAQIMATAFSVFATSTTLSGGNYASYYGFSVSSSGVGGRSVNLGSAGSELGLSDGASTSILDVLRRADARASGGSLYASNSTAFGVVYNFFDSFNRTGLIH